jgi:hypothetical protein
MIRIHFRVGCSDVFALIVTTEEAEKSRYKLGVFKYKRGGLQSSSAPPLNGLSLSISGALIHAEVEWKSMDHPLGRVIVDSAAQRLRPRIVIPVPFYATVSPLSGNVYISGPRIICFPYVNNCAGRTPACDLSLPSEWRSLRWRIWSVLSLISRISIDTLQRVAIAGGSRGLGKSMGIELAKRGRTNGHEQAAQ